MKSLILKCGNEEYRILEAELESIQNIFKKKGREFERTAKTIENLASRDYEVRKALIYRNNYLEMLKSYQNLPQYDEILKILSKYTNPLTFVRTIKEMKEGEKVGDIDYMYDTDKIQYYLNLIIEELGKEGYEDFIIKGD